MERYQIYLLRGNDLYIEGKVRLTPDTLVVEDDEGRVVAEFYRQAVAGWRKA